jgi:hypothetical protein
MTVMSLPDEQKQKAMVQKPTGAHGATNYNCLSSIETCSNLVSSWPSWLMTGGMFYIPENPLSSAVKTLWHICPMWELLKHRNLKMWLRNNSERWFPLPSPRFAPHCTLLGNAVNTGLHNSTQRRISRMPDSGFIGETEGSSQRSQESVHKLVHNQIQFTVKSRSYKWNEVEEESSSPWEHLKCDWKTFFVCNNWSVRMLQFVRRDPLLGND